jgi:hypothetical protein
MFTSEPKYWFDVNFFSQNQPIYCMKKSDDIGTSNGLLDNSSESRNSGAGLNHVYPTSEHTIQSQSGASQDLNPQSHKPNISTTSSNIEGESIRGGGCVDQISIPQSDKAGDSPNSRLTGSLGSVKSEEQKNSSMYPTSPYTSKVSFSFNDKLYRLQILQVWPYF